MFKASEGSLVMKAGLGLGGAGEKCCGALPFVLFLKASLKSTFHPILARFQGRIQWLLVYLVVQPSPRPCFNELWSFPEAEETGSGLDVELTRLLLAGDGG